MAKEKWNIRLWYADDDSSEEILPWTEVILRNPPVLDDNDPDNPRSIEIIIAPKSRFIPFDYSKLYAWIDSTFNPRFRKKPRHSWGELRRGEHHKYLNYVYIEEYKSQKMDPTDPSYREIELKLDYRSITDEAPSINLIKEK